MANYPKIEASQIFALTQQHFIQYTVVLEKSEFVN